MAVVARGALLVIVAALLVVSWPRAEPGMPMGIGLGTVTGVAVAVLLLVVGWRVIGRLFAR